MILVFGTAFFVALGWYNVSILVWAFADTLRSIDLF